MRPLHKVAEAAKKMIPDDYELRADIIFELDEVIESASYTSPELLANLWDRLCHALDPIGKPDCKWKQDLQDMMSTKLDYRTVLGE